MGSAMWARRGGRRTLFALALVLVASSHFGVEADDDEPAPIEQSEDSPEGGPFADAVEKATQEALAQKKSFDHDGGVDGVKDGAKMAKKWLKQADAKYSETGNSDTENDDESSEVD